jgi:hypothetical protein
MNTTNPNPSQLPDLGLVATPDALEALSQLLAVALRKLAKLQGQAPDAFLVVTQADVNELEGHELQHGMHPDGVAVRVAPKGQ